MPISGTRVCCTSEQAHSNTWDETNLLLCGIAAIDILGLGQSFFHFYLFYASSFSFLMTNETKWRLVFQNKYSDRMPHKLHMVCIIDLFSWELAKKNCWSQGSPSLINPRCQGCLWCFMCRLFVFLLQDFVFPPASWAYMSFHHSRGVEVLWRADGNLFFPSEMPSPMVANTSGEEVSDAASQNFSCLAAGAERSRGCAERADPGSCRTRMSLCNE